MNYTPPAFQPVIYIPVGGEAKIRGLQVQKIYAVAHDVLENGGNHWCLYLQTADHQSVCIDSTPTYSVPSTVLHDGSKANIVISHLNNCLPISAMCAVPLTVCVNLTVGSVLELFIHSGRHNYEFDSQGRGCRQWTSDQITLLEAQHYITSASEANAARNAILIQYPSGANYALVPGAYY
ncbi:hypothetical protein BKA61DRAFT_620430 [Leptodontidium sp. MPI-SDFR-AT-0119]|nr:hypothetical protein BKA61DRAFT_620430 [Leptodontidium sp. MPI-SDFR-AT-0119]